MAGIQTEQTVVVGLFGGGPVELPLRTPRVYARHPRAVTLSDREVQALVDRLLADTKPVHKWRTPAERTYLVAKGYLAPFYVAAEIQRGKGHWVIRRTFHQAILDICGRHGHRTYAHWIFPLDRLPEIVTRMGRLAVHVRLLELPRMGPLPPPPTRVKAGRRRRAATPRVTRPRAPRPCTDTPPTGMTTALYRRYDADDNLLYVGISDNPRRRGARHRKRSSWAAFAVRAGVEWFPSREAAEAAERAAIETESPLFNDRHNATPEARARLVHYLVDRGRLDLLAPAVSRG